jgi:hypothetical protein
MIRPKKAALVAGAVALLGAGAYAGYARFGPHKAAAVPASPGSPEFADRRT